MQAHAERDRLPDDEVHAQQGGELARRAGVGLRVVVTDGPPAEREGQRAVRAVVCEIEQRRRALAHRLRVERRVDDERARLVGGAVQAHAERDGRHGARLSSRERRGAVVRARLLPGVVEHAARAHSGGRVTSEALSPTPLR